MSICRRWTTGSQTSLYDALFTGGAYYNVSEIDLSIGYRSSVYGGETTCDFTPSVLMDVDSQGIYDSGQESVVESYLKAFDQARFRMEDDSIRVTCQCPVQDK